MVLPCPGMGLAFGLIDHAGVVPVDLRAFLGGGDLRAVDGGDGVDALGGHDHLMVLRAAFAFGACSGEK